MNVTKGFVRLLRLYFWLLVVGSVVTVLWLFDQFVIGTTTLATGWFALAGFGLLILVFLIALRRYVA